MSTLVDSFYHPQQNKENCPPDRNKDDGEDSDDEVFFNRKPPCAPASQVIVTTRVNSISEPFFNSFATPQKGAQPIASPMPKKKPVLIVEDSPESSPVTFKQPTRLQTQIVPTDTSYLPAALVVADVRVSSPESPVTFKRSSTALVNSVVIAPPVIPVPVRSRQEEKREVAATKIQCVFRGWLARKFLHTLQDELRVVVQKKDAELRRVTLKIRHEVDMHALEEKMAQLESEWLKKITSLANVNAIFEQLADTTDKKGPRTQQIEERKMKLALLKSARMQCKSQLEETSLPRSSFAPTTPAGAPPVSIIAAPSSAHAVQSKKRVRWLDMDAVANRI